MEFQRRNGTGAQFFVRLGLKSYSKLAQRCTPMRLSDGFPTPKTQWKWLEIGAKSMQPWYAGKLAHVFPHLIHVWRFHHPSIAHLLAPLFEGIQRGTSFLLPTHFLRRSKTSRLVASQHDLAGNLL